MFTLVVIAVNDASFMEKQNPLLSLCFVEGLVDGLSTVSVDSLYSTLKAVTRPLDTKHKMAALKDNEKLVPIITIQYNWYNY